MEETTGDPGLVEELLRIPPAVAERLGYYVYLYVDPRTNSPFYVGKGQGARVLAHLGLQDDSRKTQRIADLRAALRQPRIDILAHDLPDEASAFRIEAAVIDALGLAALTNVVRGVGAERRPLTELVAEYQAAPVEISEPSLLIRINRRYEPAMEDQALYDATRGVWRIGERRSQARLAMAVFHQTVRAVYVIDGWHPAGSTSYATRDRTSVDRPGRWEFTGHPAPRETWVKYVGKSVAHYFKQNVQSPIVYVQCPRARDSRRPRVMPLDQLTAGAVRDDDRVESTDPSDQLGRASEWPR